MEDSFLHASRQLTSFLRTQAHCDDLLLNLAISNLTGLPPLRIALPPNSIGDFATYCR